MQLTEIGVKCHQCGIRFRSRQVPIILDRGRRNSELRLLGEAQHFEPYAVCTCPSCSHADWATAFRRTEEPAVLGQKNEPPHLQYRAAALNGERAGKSFYKIGQLYLYAAWCAEDVGALPQSREYRKLAIDSFEKALADGSCPNDKRGEIQYLIGELHRRAGDFGECLEYFEKVIPHLPGKFAMMARRLMRLAEQGETAPIDFIN